MLNCNIIQFALDLAVGIAFLGGATSLNAVVNTQGNDVTFVEMNTLGGFADSPSTTFRVVDPEEAKAAIAYCCWMLETWRYNQPRLLW